MIIRDTKSFSVPVLKEVKMKLAKFLDKYDTVIFDMDGVITSEQNYWNCAALTVWEYLKWNRDGETSIDTEWAEQHLKEIRSRVFCNDEIISMLKSKGVNSNWDLGYVTVLLAWICNGREYDGDFADVLSLAKTLPDNILDAYDELAKSASDMTGFDYDWVRRNNLMWQTMHTLFQEWFLGDELIGNRSMHGRKRGLLHNEQPIVDKDRLTKMIELLSESKRICTGTGRPYVEMIQPLEAWGIRQYFAKDGLCNYNNVIVAEKKLNGTFTKPHPYMFLKALYGTDYDDKKLIDGNYNKNKIKTTLVVGDAGADILAAQAMGADFCAVLTGIQGEKARKYFENLKAAYILNSVLDFVEEV